MIDNKSDDTPPRERQGSDAQISVPAKPHMPAAAVAFLTEQLKRTHCLLEYGAGGSTRLATQLGVPHVFSVESDRAFAAAVRHQVRREAKATGTNARMIVSDVGQTGSWGYPTNNNRVQNGLIILSEFGVKSMR